MHTTMATENNNKNLNVPNLRFLEFSGEWEKVTLSDVVTRVTRKNKNNESRLPLTISAQYGLVDQISFFNKVVASADMSNYYLLKKGEFAYNKSYSSEYPWGAIKRLDRYPQGALSSLYICFGINDNVDSDFLVHYFESSKWHRAVSNIAGEGARNHGLLNIAVGDFFNTAHCIPATNKEQQKIAALLNLITERIATQIKIIEKLESLIRGLRVCLMQIENGNIVHLGEIAQIYQPQTISSTELTEDGFLVYGANGIIGKYKQYNHKTEQICITCRGNTCGMVNYTKPMSWITGNAMVINTDEHQNKVCKRYLYHYLSAYNFNSIISGSGQPQIVRTPLEQLKVPLPTFLEQKQKATFLDKIQGKIEISNKTLDLYLQQKQYLLRQMFI